MNPEELIINLEGVQEGKVILGQAVSIYPWKTH
jgi:hypothetical protein